MGNEPNVDNVPAGTPAGTPGAEPPEGGTPPAEPPEGGTPPAGTPGEPPEGEKDGVEEPVIAGMKPGELTELLEDYGLTDGEGLQEALQILDTFKSTVGDIDTLTEILEELSDEGATPPKTPGTPPANPDEETPEETIARLEREREEAVAALKERESAEVEAEESQRAIENFSRLVTEAAKLDDLSEPEREFVREYLGVGNKANEIDITNRVQVRRMAKEGVKKFEALKKQIIADYVSGKSGAPPSPPPGGGEPGTPGAPKIKNLKEARQAMIAKLKGSWK